MKEILNEILENNPELEKDKKQLWNVIIELQENNPKILISNEFKESLKSRISWLINLKQNKKTNFVILAIPVFSFIFIVAGFLYYFEKIDFIPNWKNVDLQDMKKVSEEDLQTQEIDEIWQLFEEKPKKEVEENNINNPKTSLKNDTVKDKNISKNQKEVSDNKPNNGTISDDLQNTSTNSSNDTTTINNSTKLENYFKQTNKKTTPSVSNTFSIVGDNIEDNIEDNQVMDLFEALWEEYPELSGVSKDEPQDLWVSQDRVWLYDSRAAWSDFQIIEEQPLMKSSMKFDFKSFCEQESWEYSWTGALEKCVINEKECLASEFINWTCEFSEIK